MVKIYNIHSRTIKRQDLKELKTEIDKGKDIILLNEDIRYEIIDFDKMTVVKSSNYTKNIYAFYLSNKDAIKYVFDKACLVFKEIVYLIKKIKR